MHLRTVALCGCLIGCTSGPYAVTIRSARAPTCDASLESLATSLPHSSEYPVRIVRGRPLDGVTSSGQVPLETMGRYRYIGDIESSRARSYPSQVFASLLWMPEMHETTSSGVRALCWAQAPLRALTFGAWAVLSPTSWPCFALYGQDDELHMRELARAAFAMGANTILVKDRETELVLASKSHRIINTGARSIGAYAFIDTWAPPAAIELGDEDAARLSDVAARCWSLPASVKVVPRRKTATN